MRNLSIKVLSGWELDEALPAWTRLSESLPGPGFFASPLWQVNYWRLRRSAGQPPVVIAGYGPDGSLVGVVPMTRLETGRRQHASSLRMSTGTGEYASYWCCHPDWVQSFVPAVYDFLNGSFSCWSKLVLNYLPADSSACGAWIDFCRRNRVPIEIQCDDRVPFIRVEDSSRDARALLSPKYSKEIMRKIRALEKRGDLEFTVVRDSSEFEEQFEAFLRVEASGWKGKDGGAIVLQQDTLKFWLNVAKGAAEMGRLRLYLLRCGGRAIAGELGVIWGGRFFCLKIAYDEEYSNFAPGIMMTLHALKACLEDPTISVYDRCGELPLMLKSAAEYYPTRRLVIASKSPLYRLFFRGRLVAKSMLRLYRSMTTRTPRLVGSVRHSESGAGQPSSSDS